MPLKHILRQLINNEQLVRKLADSYPIRRAAQLTAYFIHKGKEVGHDSVEKIKESDTFNRMQQEGQATFEKGKKVVRPYTSKGSGFMIRFFENFDNEWKKARKDLEQKQLEDEKKKKKF